MTVSVRPLTPQDWPHIEALFGPRGACGGCWCMSWRVPHSGKLWNSVKGDKNRASLHELAVSGKLHAVMAFHDGQPVGWCSFGPRATFPRLETVRAFRREWGPDTWAVVCFYIHPRWRRHGVARALVEAATARAFELGAAEVEGYPVTWKEGPVPAAFAYTGVPALFDAAGYVQLPSPAARSVCIKRAGTPHAAAARRSPAASSGRTPSPGRRGKSPRPA